MDKGHHQNGKGRNKPSDRVDREIGDPFPERMVAVFEFLDLLDNVADADPLVLFTSQYAIISSKSAYRRVETTAATRF
jgi:hypothetical protein